MKRDNRPNRVILLPGLGADARQFTPQREVIAHLEVPQGIEPASAEPLSHYAKRMADTLDVRTPFFLGGSSFGGIVALEMAHHIRPDAILLIGSCRSAEAVPSNLRGIARLGTKLPHMSMLFFKWMAPIIIRDLRQMTPPHKRLFLDMLSAIKPDFFRWALQAIASWRSETPPAIAIHQIHGQHDRVLPLDPAQTDAIIVADAGHLINLTHIRQVNAFLHEILWSQPESDDGANPAGES